MCIYKVVLAATLPGGVVTEMYETTVGGDGIEAAIDAALLAWPNTPADGGFLLSSINGIPVFRDGDGRPYVPERMIEE